MKSVGVEDSRPNVNQGTGRANGRTRKKRKAAEAAEGDLRSSCKAQSVSAAASGSVPLTLPRLTQKDLDDPEILDRLLKKYVFGKHCKG
jgi:hypothetical protein